MTMTNERIRKKAIEMYDDGTWGRRQIFVGKAEDLKILRHEDEALGGSGYWIDCSVFVPDDDQATRGVHVVVTRKAGQ